MTNNNFYGFVLTKPDEVRQIVQYLIKNTVLNKEDIIRLMQHENIFTEKGALQFLQDIHDHLKPKDIRTVKTNLKKRLDVGVDVEINIVISDIEWLLLKPIRPIDKLREAEDYLVVFWPQLIRQIQKQGGTNWEKQ